MKNKNVGYLVVGIAFLMAIIVLLFNFGLTKIIAQTCDHGTVCAMHDTISLQTNLSLTIVGLILIIGLFLIFSKESERIIVKKVKERVKKKKLDLSGLDDVEKKVLGILQREGGAFFQKSLMEELEIGKVKMTRMMDKLEAKQFIERKRRGMNNIIVLKQ